MWELYQHWYSSREGAGSPEVSRHEFQCTHSMQAYVTPTDNFDALADLIASYPLITRTTHFVLVPGPLDITVNSVIPRRPILPSFVSRLKSRVPHVHFASNPCRIKFFEQEIVIFREDLMSRMLRNLVGVKPDVKNDDLKRYVSSRDPEINRSWAAEPPIAGADHLGPKSPHAGDHVDTTDAI